MLGGVVPCRLLGGDGDGARNISMWLLASVNVWGCGAMQGCCYAVGW